MIKNYRKIIASVLLSLLWISSAVAADKLPEIMAGQTMVQTFGSGGQVTTNYSWSFSGGASSGDYGEIRGSGSDQSRTHFTVMAWIKTGTTQSGYSDIVSDGRSVSDDGSAGHLGGNGWALGINNVFQDNPRIEVSLGNAATKTRVGRSVPSLYDGKWHHIGFSWYSTDGKVDIFYDSGPITGAGISSGVTGSISPGVGTYTCIAGSTGTHLGDSSYVYYKGSIDEVQIYNITTDHSVDHLAAERTALSQSGLQANAESPAIDSVMDASIFQKKHVWELNNPSAPTDNSSPDSVGGMTLYFHPNGAINPTWSDNVVNSFSVAGTFYGGFIGNEVVYNYDPSAPSDSDGSGLFGFDRDALISCASDAKLADPSYKCFLKNSSDSGSTNSIIVASGRTAVNDAFATETAVLLYPSQTVFGDVYGSINNFAFWGRNLHQQESGDPQSDATWKMGGYPINESAQSKWDGDEFKKNTSKITTLQGEAPVANVDTGTRADWYLQTPTDSAPATTTMLDDSTNADASKFPEGKVWKTSGDLTINTVDKKYHGKGTIIVNGNLIIKKGFNITPAASADRLGFIVNGTVTIEGNNKIQASIYCPNSITVSGIGNVELTGSFVANNFTISATNARFYYDYALDSAWPPGFRFLNMPHPTETKQ